MPRDYRSSAKGPQADDAEPRLLRRSLKPRYPIYIPSKGRADTRFTSKTLDALELPYHIVVEPQEYDAYAAVIDPAKILVLPFANLGQGSIPARNWIWEHARASGAARHWVMDDNIRWFYRFNRNLKVRVDTPATLCAMEDFVDRYTNVVMAGPNYIYFAKRRVVIPPFILNTRVYSCILLATDAPHRWRGRYNEDTDLSLQFLKDGLCTVLFNCFLAGKAVTMTMRGGNTDELYKQEQSFDGRLAMAQELVARHPDVARLTRKFNRWHHHVDYRPFAGNQLRRRTDIDPAIFERGVDEYGMELMQLVNRTEEAAEAQDAVRQEESRTVAQEPKRQPGERLGSIPSAILQDDAE